MKQTLEISNHELFRKHFFKVFPGTCTSISLFYKKNTSFIKMTLTSVNMKQTLEISNHELSPGPYVLQCKDKGSPIHFWLFESRAVSPVLN